MKCAQYMNTLCLNWDEALHTGIIGPLVKMGFDNDTIESMAYLYNQWIATSDISRNVTPVGVMLYARLCSVDKMMRYRTTFSSLFTTDKKWAIRSLNFALSKSFKQHVSDFGNVNADDDRLFE